MTFGEKLKKIRLDRQLSQDEFAKLLNTSKQVISRYETNQRTPKITIANEYATKLDIPLNYLIDDKQDIITSDSTINNNTIGERIKKAREEKELSLQDIANSVGVAKSTIQRYEAGLIERIKLPVIQSIAQVLEIDLQWIIGNSDTMQIPIENNDKKYNKNLELLIKAAEESTEEDIQIVYDMLMAMKKRRKEKETK